MHQLQDYGLEKHKTALKPPKLCSRTALPLTGYHDGKGTIAPMWRLSGETYLQPSLQGARLNPTRTVARESRMVEKGTYVKGRMNSPPSATRFPRPPDLDISKAVKAGALTLTLNAAQR